MSNSAFQGFAQFEIILDEVSCTLPRTSFFARVPLLSSLKRTNWKEFLRTGQLVHLDTKPLQPILHPLSAVIRSGEPFFQHRPVYGCQYSCLLTSLAPDCTCALPCSSALRTCTAVANLLSCAGSLVAIMGPSGCGKTTLMGILSGRASLAHSGRVAFNGKPPTKEFDRVSAFLVVKD